MPKNENSKWPKENFDQFDIKYYRFLCTSHEGTSWENITKILQILVSNFPLENLCQSYENITVLFYVYTV